MLIKKKNWLCKLQNFKNSVILLMNWLSSMIMGFFFNFQSEVESWLYLVIPMGLVILFVFLLDFYIEAVASNHLQGPRTAVYGTYAIFISALLLGVTWNHPMVSWITTVTKDIITEDHVLSGGVIFSLMTFILGNFCFPQMSFPIIKKINFLKDLFT